MTPCAAHRVSQTLRLPDVTSATAVDLFCGYGGATLGMVRAGLEVESAYDLDPHAVRAHLALHPTIKASRRDVSRIRPSELANRFVWASPPCQPWSVANTTGPKGPDHPSYYPLTRLIEQAMFARVLVIENVFGLVSTKHGRKEMERVYWLCEMLDKPCQLLILTAAQCGLEQLRKRVFLVVGAPSRVYFDYRGASSHHYPAVTTKHSDLAEASHLQRLPNPQTLQAPDWRSGRRMKAETVTPAKLHVSRRLIGNAVPPEMAEEVCRAVLKAVS